MTEMVHVLDPHGIDWEMLDDYPTTGRLVKFAFTRVAETNLRKALSEWDNRAISDSSPAVRELAAAIAQYSGEIDTNGAMIVLRLTRDLIVSGIDSKFVTHEEAHAPFKLERQRIFGPTKAPTPAPAPVATFYELLCKILAAPRAYTEDVPKAGYEALAEAAITSDAPGSHIAGQTGVVCDVCSLSCLRIYYSCDETPDFDICQNCFRTAKKLSSCVAPKSKRARASE